MNSSRIEKEKARKAQERAARLAEKKKAASLAHFAEHSIKTQQAALHLTQFAHKEEEVGLTDHSIEALVLGLTVSLLDSCLYEFCLTEYVGRSSPRRR